MVTTRNGITHYKGFRIIQVTEKQCNRHATLTEAQPGDFCLYTREQCMSYDSPEWVAGSMKEAMDFIDTYDIDPN